MLGAGDVGRAGHLWVWDVGARPSEGISHLAGLAFDVAEDHDVLVLEEDVFHALLGLGVLLNLPNTVSDVAGP